MVSVLQSVCGDFPIDIKITEIIAIFQSEIEKRVILSIPGHPISPTSLTHFLISVMIAALTVTTELSSFTILFPNGTRQTFPLYPGMTVTQLASQLFIDGEGAQEIISGLIRFKISVTLRSRSCIIDDSSDLSLYPGNNFYYGAQEIISGLIQVKRINRELVHIRVFSMIHLDLST
jgi:hypothetical protein